MRMPPAVVRSGWITAAPYVNGAMFGPPWLHVELIYSPASPYAACAVIRSAEQPDGVPWVFSRDHLLRSVSHHHEVMTDAPHPCCGLGDVKMWYTGLTFYLFLESPAGQMTLGMSMNPVSLFAQRTVLEVAPGTESMDWNTIIAQLLAR